MAPLPGINICLYLPKYFGEGFSIFDDTGKVFLGSEIHFRIKMTKIIISIRLFKICQKFLVISCLSKNFLKKFKDNYFWYSHFTCQFHGGEEFLWFLWKVLVFRDKYSPLNSLKVLGAVLITFTPRFQFSFVKKNT